MEKIAIIFTKYWTLAIRMLKKSYFNVIQIFCLKFPYYFTLVLD